MSAESGHSSTFPLNLHIWIHVVCIEHITDKVLNSWYGGFLHG